MQRRLLLLLPLLVFVGLVLLFYVMQREMGAGRYDPQSLPSALIDQPLPEFQLVELHTGAALGRADLVGKIALLNVWATWCPSCHYEHPYLNQLAAEGVTIYGINYKDEPDKARQWLAEKGNPYALVLDDREGRLGLDLGVTGAPETYVIDGAGVVQLRYQGPVDERVWRETLQPLVERLRNEAAASS